MIEQGYIKLYRKFKDWEWYTNINVKVLFLHCLIRANHKSVKYQGIQIDRGEFMTSIRTLSIETGLSERQVRTALDKLILTSELTSKSNNKYRIIKVLKYNDYQENDKQDNKQLTNKRQTFDKPLTTNKNDKKEKNDNKSNKKMVRPTIEDVKSHCLEKGYNIDAEHFINFYESNGWKVGKNPMKSWKASLTTWSKRNQKDTTPTQTAKSKAVRDNLFRGTKYAN